MAKFKIFYYKLTVQPTKKSRAELMREIDAEYYGYLDDDDNLLVEQEEKCEKAGIQKITN
jgi:pre-mRNA-splicing factor ISY1